MVGCHIHPEPTGTYELHRQFYPIPDGTACQCYDGYGATCVASCASNVANYEIRARSGHGNVTVVCTAGNKVLGCGYKSLDTSDQWSGYEMSHVANATSCQCFNAFGVVCYATCGLLSEGWYTVQPPVTMA